MFSDWLDTKKLDILKAIDKAGSCELKEIAKLLNLTTESAAYLLARMATNEDIVLHIKKPGSTKKAPPKTIRKKTAGKK